MLLVGAARQKSRRATLILGALASPYLHDYDLLGVALAVALLVQDRLRASGFAPGETVLFFHGLGRSLARCHGCRGWRI